ncbi:MAG: indole-3-glycerol-phosphate synthase [Halobacteriales archaeon]|nr:indole-3-glycerol-phosphate synthase [Halobacteriales archaeon]
MHPDVERILEDAEERAERAERAFETVKARDFVTAVEKTKSEGRVPVIAEVKPTSPTTDGTVALDPAETAREMVAGGATALSVLTEPDRFGGSLDALREVRDAFDVPVLRKDFVVDERQIREVRADLLLLIAAFVDDLGALVEGARDAGFEPLVEVHTRDELEAALGTDARVIGVNSRDLKRLEVDLSNAESLLPEVPDDRLAVAESGMETPEDVRRMVDAGADAVLVGTAITRSSDVREKTRELVEA